MQFHPSQLAWLSLGLALVVGGCLPAATLPGPPDASASAMFAAGGRAPDDHPRPTFAGARLVGAADEEPVWNGSGRATLIGQLSWDGVHPGLPVGRHDATVAVDPRVGGGGTVSWSHLRVHGELTGWLLPIGTPSGFGVTGTIGGAASASLYAGPAELYLAADGAAGGWTYTDLFSTGREDREVATAALGAAIRAGPVCIFVAGGPSRVAQHGMPNAQVAPRPQFHWAQSAWVIGAGARLESEPDER